MKQRFTALSLWGVLGVGAWMEGAAIAQEADTMPARPMYGHLKPNLRADIKTPATPLTTWNGTFVYKTKTYKYNMVGTTPTTGTSTTIPVFIIPVKLQYVTTHGTQSFTPNTKLSNGQTAIQNIVASPMFQTGVDFTSNGVDLGSTQYIDAYQRGNFWGQVSLATGYHLLLGTPKVQPVLTLTVPAADGKVGTEFGVRVGLADINWFDAQLQSYITSHTTIVPNSLPIFVTYDAYLTSGGCCIGGGNKYHRPVVAPRRVAHRINTNHHRAVLPAVCL